VELSQLLKSHSVLDLPPILATESHRAINTSDQIILAMVQHQIQATAFLTVAVFDFPKSKLLFSLFLSLSMD
jgi:hypothetical protein